MRTPTNKARQLLALPTFFQGYADDPIGVAIAKVATDEGMDVPGVNERLHLLLLLLPQNTIDQGHELLGPTFGSYRPGVERVRDHFRSLSMNNTWPQYAAVMDESAVLALRATADLVDGKLRLTSADADSLAELDAQVRSVIDEIRENTELDSDVQRYLLTVAVHLRQMVQHFDIFGVDGIVDLQGRFMAEMFNWFPDIVPNSESTEEDAPAKRFARVLWNLTCTAAVVTGLTTDGIEIVNHVRALLPGH